MRAKENKRAYSLTLFIFLAALCLYVFRAQYLPYAGRYLVVEDNLEKADAIFVFGGSIPNRIIEAAEIYKNGFSPLIIISKYPKPEGYKYLSDKGILLPEGHDITKSIAVRMGIPEENLLVTEYRNTSTFEELVRLIEFCRENKFEKVILVSTKSHTRRISKIFSDLSGGHVKEIVRYTRFDSYNPDDWWRDRNSLRQTVFEYQKLLYHMLADRDNIKKSDG